eukprot:TRINITY_DN3048_c0_g1_i1.p2 TRINITY_DN3048_c0_g1~~TRINITY_DN3048_c0_g1_i1.p2  ORF type:complete len:127 (+),score=46.05 TRINITY_DN3048_c0_g1_i1:184-564(+)
MSKTCTVRTRKFMVNRLLERKQMLVDVVHDDRANVPKSELAERLATMYKVDTDRVVLYGFRTKFGGGQSTGFGLVYDSLQALKKNEPEYRLIRAGHKQSVEKSRKQRKELKNRLRGKRGVKALAGN